MKKSALLIGLKLILLGLVMSPGSVYAMRPYRLTDNAVTLERGTSRFDFGVMMSRQPDNKKIKRALAELTFGMINNLDFEIEVPYYTVKEDKDTRSGLGDLTMKGKITILKGRQPDMLYIAGMLVAKFPSCDEAERLVSECTGEPDQGIKFLASRTFYSEETGGITLHLNLEKRFIGNPVNEKLNDITLYSLGLETPTGIKEMKFIGEFAGETNRNPKVQEDLQYILAGITSEVSKRLAVNGAVSFGATNASDDYSLDVGLNYKF